MNLTESKKVLFAGVSLLLIIALTDYIWVKLVEDDRIVSQINAEENAFEEELRFEKNQESEFQFSPIAYFTFPYLGLNHSLFSGFVKKGNIHLPSTETGGPELYIIFHALKIYCS